MRMFRTIVSALLASLLSVALVGAAGASEVADRAQPKRIIEEKPPRDHQVSYNAFKLKGKVTEPQVDGTLLPYVGKVKVQKKACGGCKWKTVKKLKTNANGAYKTKIYAPDKGRWKWRSKVDHSNGFGNTKGNIWTLYFD